MKVVVPVKQVARLDDEAELVDARTVDPDALEWELNGWDGFSVEAALQLTEGADGGEVVVVSVGDDEAEEGLLACLAKGADRAIRVWDDGLADADPLAIARVLAEAVRAEQPDLVLCGAQSSDTVASATGVALAAHLGLPRVAVVKRLDYDAGSGTATVQRELEGGTVEVLRVSCPALLTIQTGINEPRYATLRAIKQAREKPLEVRDLGALGLSAADVAAAAGSRTRALRPHECGEGAQMLDGSAADVAGRIAEIVKERMGA